MPITETEWFEPGTQPEQAGVYKVEIDATRSAWQHWNKAFWGHRKSTPEAAGNQETAANWVSEDQSPRWKGLTGPAASMDEVEHPTPSPAVQSASSADLFGPADDGMWDLFS